ncbi:MAG TPA: hypothetical protein VF576_08215 [Rubricoccaceae bacterium]
MSADSLADLRQDLTASVFAPHVGTAFTAWVGGEPVPLALTGVEGTGPDPDRSFVLTFRTHGPRSLSQGTYPLEHEGVGRLALFLVPLRADADGAVYEAVFNRSLAPGR